MGEVRRSRVEINFRRLLSQSESLASQKYHDKWRIEKYVEHLQELLTELKKSNADKRLSDDVLAEYQKRVGFLKGVVETERLSSTTEKALANQLLVPSHDAVGKKLTSAEELHMQKTSQYTQQMRHELLNTNNSKDVDGNILRHRTDAIRSAKDVDTELQHHENVHEQLTEEMLALTQTLKENTIMAGNIVREDNKVLADSLRYADVNTEKLRSAGEILSFHVNKSCSWWIWIMIAVVCITFVWMIIFMKLNPKLKS